MRSTYCRTSNATRAANSWREESLTKKVLVLIECLGYGLRERDHVQADCVDAAATQAAQPGVSYPSAQQDPILGMQLTGLTRRVFSTA